MTYTIEKSKILYNCPGCNNPLESRLEEAGAQDTCPICGRTFVVPAREEVQRLQAEKARLAALRRQQEELAAAAHKEQQARMQEHAAAELEAEQARTAEHRRVLEAEESRRRQELERQAKTTIPAYTKIRAYSDYLVILGWLCYLGAGLVGIIAFAAGAASSTPGPVPLMMGLLSAISLAVAGFLFCVSAEMLSAFRDIAVNSWRTAIAAERNAGGLQ